MKFQIIFLILNYLQFIKTDYNRLIRVDGINPTCNERPDCKDYEVDGALINVDKSLPYMGSTTCCLLFKADDEKHQQFFARILTPTYLGGSDYISFFRNDFNTLVANVTASDKNPYRVIYLNSSKILVEFHKDKNYRSTFDILITAYYEKSSRKCLKEKFTCEQSKICIDEDLQCDRFPHCPDDEDEENCTSSHSTVNLDDLRPTISIALCILIGIMCLMVLSSIVCCLCRRKTNNGRLGRRLFSGSLNTGGFFPRCRSRSSSNSIHQEETNQSPIRLHITHVNRNKPINNLQQSSLASTNNQTSSQISQNPPPPSYEEATGKIMTTQN